MKTSILHTILATLALTAGGCRNSVSSCEEAFTIDCERRFRCCEDEEIHAGGALPYVTSEGECAERSKGFCQFLAFADESVAAGRAEFDNELASKCLDQLKEARDTCDPDVDTDDDCDLFFIEGLVDDGDECANEYECADEGQCKIDYDEDFIPEDVDVENGTAVGECVARLDEGDSCIDGGECKSALYCDFNDGTCAKKKPNGETCTAGEECTSNFCDGVECAEIEQPDNETCDGRD